IQIGKTTEVPLAETPGSSQEVGQGVRKQTTTQGKGERKAAQKEVVGEKEKPKSGDPLRSLADKIRQGKIKKLGGFRAGTGFDSVWDGSLEVVASSLEAG